MFFILPENLTEIEEFFIKLDFGWKNFGVQNDTFLCYFYYTQNVGVNYLTSVLASVEAHREVRCGLHCADI